MKNALIFLGVSVFDILSSVKYDTYREKAFLHFSVVKT